MGTEGVIMPEVIGLIRDKWLALGGDKSFLGQPLTDELGTPDGTGRFNHFQGGSIYWTPATGAHEVHGAIRNKWEAMGWERGSLGFPLTDELGTPDGTGRFNHFQGGSLYWTLATGAHEVHGAIRDKWGAMGWERGILGFPLTDEITTPDGIGRFVHFQRGSIYWTLETGAHEVHGAIRDKWADMGWERSSLGYPLSDETSTPDKQHQVSLFQRGSITWSPSTLAVIVSRDLATFDSGPLTSDLPLGGSLQIVMRRNGNVTFRCHAHDSGFDNIDYVIAAVLMTPAGMAFTFQHSGSVEGTVAGLPFGTPDRDDDFVSTVANNPLITTEWEGIQNAKLVASISGKDTLVGGITEFLGDLVSKVAEEFGKQAAKAVVALVL